MLGDATQEKIVQATGEYWTKHVGEQTFAELVRGKKPGHRMADYVDDFTVDQSTMHFVP